LLALVAALTGVLVLTHVPGPRIVGCADQDDTFDDEVKGGRKLMPNSLGEASSVAYYFACLANCVEIRGKLDTVTDP
jgi:hypothetical protein